MAIKRFDQRQAAIDAICLYAKLNNIWGPERFEQRDIAACEFLADHPVPPDFPIEVSRIATKLMGEDDGGVRFKVTYCERYKEAINAHL